LQTAATLSEAGLVVRDAVTLIDRQEGGRAALKAAGINLVSILTLEQIANYLMSQGYIPEDAYRRTMAYLESHQQS
jgi:orotate phosphoribosyltransferase